MEVIITVLRLRNKPLLVPSDGLKQLAMGHNKGSGQHLKVLSIVNS